MSQLKKDSSQTRNPGQPGAQPAPAAAPADPARRSQKNPDSKPKAPPAARFADPGTILGVVPLESFVAAQRSQLEALAKATNLFMAGLTAINREMVDFGDRRAQALLDGSKSAPKTGDWNEILHFQIDYAGHATQAYMEEATKLFDLGVKVSQESWMPLQESMTTALDGIFRKTD